MIAKETVELIKKIPSKLKYDNHLRDIERARQGKPKDSIIYYERLLIRDRWERIKQRPGWKKGTIYLKEWVQSSVWYNLNKQYLIPNEVKVTAHTRDYVTSNIRRLCAELETEWEVSREEVAITASTRAFLYFNGAWLAVDISKIEELSKLGTDQVFIEKRGGIDQVTTSVGHFGIAFCNTQGHFVEYAEDLTKAAKSAKANILHTLCNLQTYNLVSCLPIGLRNNPFYRRMKIVYTKVEEQFTWSALCHFFKFFLEFFQKV